MTAAQLPYWQQPEEKAIQPLVGFVVHGQPKPKGSMRHVGRGRMVEQVEGSRPWREAVKYAALDAVRALGSVTPFDGPLQVEVFLSVIKPQSAPKTRRTWPVTRSSGDVDKHGRNVLDALVDAGVLRDDSTVIRLIVEKDYIGAAERTLPAPGAHIQIAQVLA